MEKNTNHELNVVVAAIMADPVPTLLALALSLKRCVSSDARRNFRAYCAGAGDHIEVSSVIGAVREVAINYTPIIVKDLVLKLLVPTIDEGDDLKEDCHRATGCKEDIVHHIYCLYLFLF